MKYLYYLVLLLTCLGCKKEEPVIEIYLLKSKVNELIEEDFNVELEDLMDEPFIINSEIKGLDIRNNQLILDSAAVKKVDNLEIDLSNGVPFVIMTDDEIVFKGRFWSVLSSFYPKFPVVFYSPMNTEYMEDYIWNRNEVLILKVFYTNNDTKHIYARELISAFRESNRLIGKETETD